MKNISLIEITNTSIFYKRTKLLLSTQVKDIICALYHDRIFNPPNETLVVAVDVNLSNVNYDWCHNDLHVN